MGGDAATAGKTGSVSEGAAQEVGITEQGSKSVKPTTRLIRRFTVRGSVPVENYGELFRCFVGPSARMNLKKLHLGVQFEMVAGEGHELNVEDPAIKAMKEAARQLGLTFEIED